MDFRSCISRRGAVVSLAASAWLCGGAPVLAQDHPADPLHQAERSVVRVVTVSLDTLGEPVSLDTGSGFVVAAGKVVTNRHVVAGAPGAAQVQTFVIPERDVGGQSEKAQVRQTWDDADLALLDAPGLPSPPIGIAQLAPDKEATVRAIGYPGVADEVRNLPLAEILRPQETYVTAGSIALFSAVAPGGRRIDSIFHTAAINPGNSGGPLIDDCGRVIGVNTWGAGAQLAADGELSSPQGQFIATRADVLAKFLGDAQIATTIVTGPCVPAAAQTLQDRLNLDENAIAAQRDQLSKLQTALSESHTQEDHLALWLAGLAAVLGGLIAALLAIRFRPPKPPVGEATAPPPTQTATDEPAEHATEALP